MKDFIGYPCFARFIGQQCGDQPVPPGPPAWVIKDSEIDLYFNNLRYFYAPVGEKTFSEILAHSRASNASYFDENGMYQVARANLVLYSEDLTNGGYDSGTVSKTAGQADPLGGTGATLLGVTATNDYRSQISYNSVLAGQTQTAYVWLKGTLGETIQARLFRQGAGTAEGTAVVHTFTGDWDRVKVTHTFANNQSETRLDVGRISSASNATSFSVFGYMIVTGNPAVDSPYVKTTGAVNGPPRVVPGKGYLSEKGSTTNLLLSSNSLFQVSWVTGADHVWTNNALLTNGVMGSELISELDQNNYSIYNSTAGNWIISQTSYTISSTAARIIVTFTVPAGCTLVRVYPNRNMALDNFSYSLISVTPGAVYTFSWFAQKIGNAYRTGGVQVEAGGEATSLIETEGAQATRAADVCFMDVTLDPAAITMVVDADVPLVSGVTNSRLIAALDDNSFDNRIWMVDLQHPSNVEVFVGSGNSTQAQFTSLGTRTARHKMAVSSAANDFRACLNAGTVSSDTSGAAPVSLTKLRVGCDHQGNRQTSGWVKRVTVIPAIRDNSQLQALTTV